MARLFPSLVSLGRWQRLVVCLGIIGSLGLASSQAYAWGSGTHNYVADVLGSTHGTSNYQEMYGGMAMDTFSFSFDQYSIYMAGLLHTDAAIELWNSAQIAGPKSLPVAFGFMTHNDVWGADYTAHHNGIISPYQNTGYVIAKANYLQTNYSLSLYGISGVPLNVELAMDQLVVETAVDVLLKQLDPRLGQKITQAARLRPPEFPALLVDAYAHYLVSPSTTAGITPLSLPQAKAFIYASEGAFQNTMELYGQALRAKQPVPLLASQLAALAKIYLGSLSPSEELLTTLLSDYINLAMGICGDDFAAEIAATNEFVGAQLQGLTYDVHGITNDVSTVPLPPTVWLFGSGLLGLVGWRRFRKS